MIVPVPVLVPAVLVRGTYTFSYACVICDSEVYVFDIVIQKARVLSLVLAVVVYWALLSSSVSANPLIRVTVTF